MQKAIRLNIAGRNSTLKARRKFKEAETKQAWKDWHQLTNRQKVIHGEFRAEERLARRQDWIAGPLAPNRNSGARRGTYGTVTTTLTQLPEIPKSVREGPRLEGYAVRRENDKKGFKGKTIVGNVVQYDRVVIVAGPERLRGLIGTVNHVDHVKEEVKLRNINTVDVEYPAYAQPPASASNPDPAKFTTMDLPIPMSHVRLIVETDEGDAIVRHVHAGPPYVQREIGSNLPSHTRYITGAFRKIDEHGKEVSNKALERGDVEYMEEPVEFPWPPQHFPDGFDHFEGDTQRTAVSRPTWTISMIGSPLGYRTEVPSVIDVSDSPYSRAPHLSTIDVKGTDGLQNIQRVGLDSFIDHNKLVARSDRIAAGIMNELRNKYRPESRRANADFVKRSMLEDARAIWYQGRKLMTPQAQAAELAVEKRIIERELEFRKKTDKQRAVEISKLAASIKKRETEVGDLSAKVEHKTRRGAREELERLEREDPEAAEKYKEVLMKKDQDRRERIRTQTIIAPEMKRLGRKLKV